MFKVIYFSQSVLSYISREEAQVEALAVRIGIKPK